MTDPDSAASNTSSPRTGGWTGQGASRKARGDDVPPLAGHPARPVDRNDAHRGRVAPARSCEVSRQALGAGAKGWGAVGWAESSSSRRKASVQ
jgi:hypothetical protein